MQTHTAASSNETHADVYSCLYPSRPMQTHTAASSNETHTDAHGSRLTIAAFQLVVGQTDVLEQDPQ